MYSLLHCFSWLWFKSRNNERWEKGNVRHHLLKNVQKVFLYEFEKHVNSEHFLDVKSLNEETREQFENNNQEYFELKLSQEENYANQQITAIKRFSIRAGKRLLNLWDDEPRGIRKHFLPLFPSKGKKNGGCG